MIYPSQRWRISLPFVLALATLFFLGWTTTEASSYPYDGIVDISSSGEIIEISSGGPTFNKLEIGDFIVLVDGVPWINSLAHYPGKHAGDEVQFLVKRGENFENLVFTLAEPPFHEFFTRLTTILVALTFWVVGVGVQTFKPSDEASDLFFLFCQSSALLSSAGLLSKFGYPWSISLFYFLIWLIGPLSVHFHLRFPQTTFLKGQKFFISGLYSLVVIGGLPYLIFGWQTIRSSPWYPQMVSVGQLFLALNLMIVVGLLFYSYRNATTPGVRGKIRIVVLGGVLTALPLVTLTIIPYALSQRPVIPDAFAFFLLCIIPLTYGYAIFRHRLIEIDRHINRGATFILVYSILGGFYFILNALLHRWLPFTLAEEPLINTLLVLILATFFVPLHRQVQRIVDKAFYGGWYDYRSAVTQITQGLEQITNLKSLAETISERLVRTLRLEDSCVFLRDLDGVFSVIDVAPHGKISEREPRTFPVLPKTSLTYLLKLGAVEKNSLREALSQVTLSPEEHQLLDSEQVHLWVPIIGHGEVLGLLALGPKYGGDVFSGEDMDILRVVSRHLAPLIENIHLVTRLKRHAANLEQRVAERTAELHSAKERVEAILASVGDGVVVTNLDWTVITVNAAFEKQIGYETSEVVGRKVWAFVNVQDAGFTVEEIKTALQKGSTWTGELISYRKDNSPYDVQLTIAPVHDQFNNLVGYVGSQRDITKHKQLERLKDRLIFDVSHELRTPVTNLNLYLELLESGRPEKRADYTAVLKEESGRLIDLIESILDLSRLDMWKSKKMAFSAIDLNMITEQVVDAHRPLAESAGLRLKFIPDLDLPLIQGEPNQLARLIMNLLSNSIRYTLEGRITLRTFQEYSQVCLQVEDTGIGIEPEDLPHVFDRFYRGRQVSQSKITGTGLGLAIVKEILEIHEGKIEVTSEVGRGSTFRVLLPVPIVEIVPEKRSLYN